MVVTDMVTARTAKARQISAREASGRGCRSCARSTIWPRASSSQSAGDGLSLLTRRAIGHDPYRINRLVRWARGHQRRFSDQRLGRKESQSTRNKVFRLFKPPRPNFSASHVTIGWPPNLHTTLHERGDIGLGGGVGPHDRIHGRRNRDRAVGGQ